MGYFKPYYLLLVLFSAIVGLLVTDNMNLTLNRPLHLSHKYDHDKVNPHHRHLLHKSTESVFEEYKDLWDTNELDGHTKEKVKDNETWFYSLEYTKVSPYIYKSVEQNKHFCKLHNGLVVLVAVLSSPRNIAQRGAIRKTWGNFTESIQVGEYSIQMKTLFFTGLSERMDTNDKLLIEAGEYKDLVIDDFIDSYQNLSIKSIMLLHWVRDNCNNVDYVAKVDDDMLLNPKAFLSKVVQQPRTNALFGAKIGGNLVNRLNRWAVPVNEFPFSILPRYLAGNLYVMSTDVAVRIFNASEYFHQIRLEDLYITGVLSVLIGVRPIGVQGFPIWLTSGTDNLCLLLHDELVGVHQVRPNTIERYWHKLQTGDKMCLFAEQNL